MSTTAPVRVGVLGAADIARRRMLPAFAGCAGTEIAAVASRDAARAADLAASFGGDPVHGYAAVLERDDVDAVYVPLPVALHAEWVERALRAGKHVLAEKPLTHDTARTVELLELARESDLVLMENVMFVHHPQHAAVTRLVRSGAIGELRSLHASFTIPELPSGDIRYDASLGGGVLLDVGLYPARAALHLLGDRLRVCGALAHTPEGRAVETAGGALLTRADGVSAHLEYGIGFGYRSRYELCGSTGRITVPRAFTPPADHRPRITVETRDGVEELLLDAHDQVAGTVAAFAGAVHGTGPGPDHDAVVRQAELLGEIRSTAVRTRFRTGLRVTV